MTAVVLWDRKLKTALEAVYERGSLWVSHDERLLAPYRVPEVSEWVRLSPAVMQAQGRSIQGVLITPRFDLPTWTTTLHYAAETTTWSHMRPWWTISHVQAHDGMNDYVVQFASIARENEPPSRIYALRCYRAHLDRDSDCLQLDFLTPATSRLPAEAQQGLKQWLIELSWYGWATASEELRAYAGHREGPIPLKHASEEANIHFSTLTKAAREGRLPTIPAGDRRLVYTTTVREAVERGLVRPGSE